MGLRILGVRIACALLMAASPAFCRSSAMAQGPVDPEPIVSDKALTAEQLAIYREVLKGWMDDGKSPLHLSIQTVPIDRDELACMKGLSLEKRNLRLVHRFRPDDLPKLGSGRMSLVDPEQQQKEIEKNDPGTAIRNGQSVDEAVSNGFAHGLVTLGEIQFDEKHQRAVVWFGFRCGGLCGNGGTVVLEKKNGIWHKKTRPCSIWMS